MEQIIVIENIDTSQDIPVENSNEVLNMNYNQASNKPKINNVTLEGNKTLDDLGIQPKGNYITEEADPIYNADKPNIALKTDIPDISGKLDNSHNTSETSHLDIRDLITIVEAIARGKARSRVFATVEDLDTWLEDEEHVADLEVGDNFFIEDTAVPDYWWNGETKMPLEAEIVALVDYYTKDEVNTRLGLKQDTINIPYNTVPYRGDSGTGTPNTYLSVSQSANSNSVARRTSSGALATSDATDIGYAVNLGQMNTALPYYQTKTSLDSTLLLGTKYELGTLTGNISFALPTPSGATNQKILVKFDCGATPYTFTLTGSNFTAFNLTPVANTAYDIEFEWNNAKGKWTGFVTPYLLS